MIVFIDDILNGNIKELLGSELYAQTISKIVEWWAILPMVGIILILSLSVVSLFKSRQTN